MTTMTRNILCACEIVNLDGALSRGKACLHRRPPPRLDGAVLDEIKRDLFEVLDAAQKEVSGLLAALEAGKINGSVYTGECACLIGTIANVRGCTYDDLGDLRPNPSRPAERWFLAVRKGHTPENHPVAKITAGWIREWLDAHPE